MATAPRPTSEGVEVEQAAVDEASKVTAFVVRGVTYKLAVRNVRIGEKVAVKKATGLSWTEVIGEDGSVVGVESVAIFMWLARRAAGEPGLPWQVFERECPDDLSMGDVEWPDQDADGAGDDPEA